MYINGNVFFFSLTVIPITLCGIHIIDEDSIPKRNYICVSLIVADVNSYLGAMNNFIDKNDIFCQHIYNYRTTLHV